MKVTGEAASAFSRRGVRGREGYRLGVDEGVGSLFALASRMPSVRRATYRMLSADARCSHPCAGTPAAPTLPPTGMDHSDGIEGLYLEKMAVAGRNLQDRAEDAPSTSGSVGGDGSAGVRKKRGKGRSDVDLLLGGVPYRHYVSAQCNKEHKAVQVRRGLGGKGGGTEVGEEGEGRVWPGVGGGCGGHGCVAIAWDASGASTGSFEVRVGCVEP